MPLFQDIIAQSFPRADLERLKLIDVVKRTNITLNKVSGILIFEKVPV